MPTNIMLPASLMADTGIAADDLIRVAIDSDAAFATPTSVPRFGDGRRLSSAFKQRTLQLLASQPPAMRTAILAGQLISTDWRRGMLLCALPVAHAGHPRHGIGFQDADLRHIAEVIQTNPNGAGYDIRAVRLALHKFARLRVVGREEGTGNIWHALTRQVTPEVAAFLVECELRAGAKGIRIDEHAPAWLDLFPCEGGQQALIAALQAADGLSIRDAGGGCRVELRVLYPDF